MGSNNRGVAKHNYIESDDYIIYRHLSFNSMQTLIYYVIST